MSDALRLIHPAPALRPGTGHALSCALVMGDHYAPRRAA